MHVPSERDPPHLPIPPLLFSEHLASDPWTPLSYLAARLSVTLDAAWIRWWDAVERKCGREGRKGRNIWHERRRGKKKYNKTLSSAVVGDPATIYSVRTMIPRAGTRSSLNAMGLEDHTKGLRPSQLKILRAEPPQSRHRLAAENRRGGGKGRERGGGGGQEGAAGDATL